MTETEWVQLQMDVAVWNAELKLRKAIDEGRHILTNSERCCFILAKMDRNKIWQEWISQEKAAGRYVLSCDERWANDEPYHCDGVRLKNDGSRRQLFIYGQIGALGITAAEVQRQLESVPDNDPLDVRVFSDGGSLAESIGIHNLLKSRSGPTRGYVDSIAASGGSVLLMGCDAIIMLTGTWMMIHGVQVELKGSRSVPELRELADFADEHNDTLFRIYRPRWKGSDESLKKALDDETWLSADDAVSRGLADRVLDKPAVAARLSSRNLEYKCAPECVMLSARADEYMNLRSKLADLTIHRACVV